jgi:hypothetical protein
MSARWWLRRRFPWPNWPAGRGRWTDQRLRRAQHAAGRAALRLTDAAGHAFGIPGKATGSPEIHDVGNWRGAATGQDQQHSSNRQLQGQVAQSHHQSPGLR